MTITTDPPHTVLVKDLDDDHDSVREALRQIKADPRLKAIAVVVVATSAHPGDVNHGYPCGANPYHVMPTRCPDHLQMLTGRFDYRLADVMKPNAHGAAP